MHHIISFILRIAYAACFGYILMLHTNDIINYIPQLLGGLLMLECVAQLLELFYLKAKTEVNTLFFIVPVAVLVYGLFLIFGCSLRVDPNAAIREVFNPSAGWSMLTMWMKIGGFCCLAFVISEIVISIAFFKPIYRPAKFAEEMAQKKEAQKALEAERIRMEELAAKKEKELAAEKLAAEKAAKASSTASTTETTDNKPIV